MTRLKTKVTSSIFDKNFPFFTVTHGKNSITHLHKLERGFQNQKNSGFKQAQAWEAILFRIVKIIFP